MTRRKRKPKASSKQPPSTIVRTTFDDVTPKLTDGGFNYKLISATVARTIDGDAVRAIYERI